MEPPAAAGAGRRGRRRAPLLPRPAILGRGGWSPGGARARHHADHRGGGPGQQHRCAARPGPGDRGLAAVPGRGDGRAGTARAQHGAGGRGLQHQDAGGLRGAAGVRRRVRSDGARRLARARLAPGGGRRGPRCRLAVVARGRRPHAGVGAPVRRRQPEQHGAGSHPRVQRGRAIGGQHALGARGAPRQRGRRRAARRADGRGHFLARARRGRGGAGRSGRRADGGRDRRAAAGPRSGAGGHAPDSPGAHRARCG